MNAERSTGKKEKNLQSRRSIIAFGLIFLTMLISCETIIEIDLPQQDPLLVINSTVEAGQPWDVHITRTVGILEDGPAPVINDATVEVLAGGEVIATLAYVGDGSYRSTANMPQAGNQYTLNVSAPGFASITATTKIPVPTAIESATVLGYTQTNGPREYDLEIVFSDDGAVSNFYALRMIDRFYNGPSGGEYLYFTSKEPALQGNTQFFVLDEENTFEGIEALFDDVLINGKRNQLNVFLFSWDRFPASQITVELLSITQTHFQYALAADLQQETEDNPFSEPVLIPGNINNGLGIFVGISRTRTNVSGGPNGGAGG